MTIDKKKTKKQKIKRVKCSDCNAEYQLGAPHGMFCHAKTCTECGTTFGYVLPIYDSRPEAYDSVGNPSRLCEECQEVIESERP